MDPKPDLQKTWKDKLLLFFLRSPFTRRLASVVAGFLVSKITEGLLLAFNWLVGLGLPAETTTWLQGMLVLTPDQQLAMTLAVMGAIMWTIECLAAGSFQRNNKETQGMVNQIRPAGTDPIKEDGVIINGGETQATIMKGMLNGQAPPLDRPATVNIRDRTVAPRKKKRPSRVYPNRP